MPPGVDVDNKVVIDAEGISFGKCSASVDIDEVEDDIEHIKKRHIEFFTKADAAIQEALKIQKRVQQMRDDFIDRFNAKVFEENKDLPLEKVKKEFHNSYDEFLAQIRNLDEEMISQTLPFEWAKDTTVEYLIAANTHWHYKEHAESIRRWQKQACRGGGRSR